MPFYQYTCAKCGEFPLWRLLSKRNLPAKCPHCRAEAERMISAPQLNLMPAGRRAAYARNEKSRHEPGVQPRHRCGTGCGCGTAKAKTAKSTRTVNLGSAGRFEAPKPSKRPWMLGH